MPNGQLPPDPTEIGEEESNRIAAGGRDGSGRSITEIYWSTKKFILYEADGQVRYLQPSDYDTARALREKSFTLEALRASIERLRAHPTIPEAERRRAGRELAWALAQAFETKDDAEEATKDAPAQALRRTEARLRSLVKSHLRKRYIYANIIAFLGITFILLLLVRWLADFGAVQSATASVSNIIGLYASYCVFGALGSFLSVAMGIRSLDMDIDLKGWEHVFAGAIRIFIGVIGAIIIGLAIDSNFLNPDFSAVDAKLSIAVYFFLSFLAGFSETLVPNLLRRGEQASGASGNSDRNSAQPQSGQ